MLKVVPSITWAGCSTPAILRSLQRTPSPSIRRLPSRGRKILQPANSRSKYGTWTEPRSPIVQIETKMVQRDAHNSR